MSNWLKNRNFIAGTSLELSCSEVFFYHDIQMFCDIGHCVQMSKQVQTILTDVSKQRVDEQSQQQRLMHPFDMLVDDSGVLVADSCFLYRCNTSHVNEADSCQDIEQRDETVCATDIIPESRTVFAQPYCLCGLSGTEFDGVGIMLVGDRKVRLTHDCGTHRSFFFHRIVFARK